MLLDLLAGSAELSHVHIRRGEKKLLNTINTAKVLRIKLLILASSDICRLVQTYCTLRNDGQWASRQCLGIDGAPNQKIFASAQCIQITEFQ